MRFNRLPLVHNAKGDVRKVGLELEFSNVDIAQCVDLIKQLYGGKVQVKHRFSQKVVGTRLGDFTVELDLKLLTEKKYKALFDSLNIDLESIKIGDTTLEEKVEDALETMIRKVIPYEISAPPVPCTELHQLEPLRQALFEHKAEGTEAFWTNAFGMHINPELPNLETGTILRYLKAFLVLYPLLLKTGKTDFARRHMTTFINPFPEEYTDRVLQPSYSPDLNQLIDEYHQFNPDRNRPLDLYPLFASLREEKIKSFSNLGTVNPRETFHYRLPNSCVSDPKWTLAQEWNRWVTIEELANSPARLDMLCQEYLTIKENTLLGFEEKWTKKTEQWLY
ncbi:amidoligase family protein [Rufibacter sp. LB8]|uniref:amidoligase family protein n=1 Tax=Rufibacter sp. LB8 TaxID=2777781 RepID=UPI00178C2DA1|nr:amidoligase family protein [Rufibacter sp. LB8]